MDINALFGQDGSSDPLTAQANEAVKTMRFSAVLVAGLTAAFTTPFTQLTGARRELVDHNIGLYNFAGKVLNDLDLGEIRQVINTYTQDFADYIELVFTEKNDAIIAADKKVTEREDAQDELDLEDAA